MANYIPQGWALSPQGAERYQAVANRVEALIRRRVGKYALPSMDCDDLLQEGRIAAAYAVDTFKDGSGKLDNYVGVVVERALGMVAREALTVKRHPRTPTMSIESVEDQLPSETVDLLVEREELEAELAERIRRLTAIESLQLSPDSRTLLHLRMYPPPQLEERIRKLSGLLTRALAQFLGWPMARFQRAAQEIRAAIRELQRSGGTP